MRFLITILVILGALAGANSAAAQNRKVEGTPELYGYTVRGKYLTPMEGEMFKGAVDDYYAGLKALNDNDWARAGTLCAKSLRMLDHLGIPDEGNLTTMRQDLGRCLADAQWFGGDKLRACQSYLDNGRVSFFLKDPIDSCATYLDDLEIELWNAFIRDYKTFNSRIAGMNAATPGSSARTALTTQIDQGCYPLAQHDFTLAKAVGYFCYGVVAAEQAKPFWACENWWTASRKLAEARRKPPLGTIADGWNTTANAIEGSLRNLPQMCADAGFAWPSSGDDWPYKRPGVTDR